MIPAELDEKVMEFILVLVIGTTLLMSLYYNFKD